LTLFSKKNINENMATITKNKEIKVLGTLEIRGEKFIVLKKEYLNKLLVLLQSVIIGERLLKEKKTRTFTEFLKRKVELKKN